MSLNSSLFINFFLLTIFLCIPNFKSQIVDNNQAISQTSGATALSSIQSNNTYVMQSNKDKSVKQKFGDNSNDVQAQVGLEKSTAGHIKTFLIKANITNFTKSFDGVKLDSNNLDYRVTNKATNVISMENDDSVKTTSSNEEKHFSNKFNKKGDIVNETRGINVSAIANMKTDNFKPTENKGHSDLHNLNDANDNKKMINFDKNDINNNKNNMNFSNNNEKNNTNYVNKNTTDANLVNNTNDTIDNGKNKSHKNDDGDYGSIDYDDKSTQNHKMTKIQNTTHQPISSTNQTITSTNQPISSTNQPMASTHQPITSTHQPIASTNQPIVSTHHGDQKTHSNLIFSVLSSKTPAYESKKENVGVKQSFKYDEENKEVSYDGENTSKAPVGVDDEEVDGADIKPSSKKNSQKQQDLDKNDVVNPDEDDMLKEDELDKEQFKDYKQEGIQNYRPITLGENKTQSEDPRRDSHFMTSLVSIVIFAVLFYLLYHNKNKILAYIIEGRKSRPIRRRRGNSSSVEYSALSNQEDSAQPTVVNDNKNFIF